MSSSNRASAEAAVTAEHSGPAAAHLRASPPDGERVGATLPPHLYLHVPFCRSRCSYCDFYSQSDLSAERAASFLSDMLGELDRWRDHGLPGAVKTVYAGGGTPTAFAHLLPLLGAVTERFPIEEGAEVTVETNPGVEHPQLRSLAGIGVTRVSVGVQSLVDDELRVLGRSHSAEQALSTCAAVHEAGLDLSLDLMCGIPGQSPESWTHTLELAIDTGARHISVYPLALEEGTPLAAACEAGTVRVPDDDSVASMMLVAEEHLEAAGIARYEVANYAEPGRESRHNSAYWTGSTYLGVGPAAHSMFDASTAVAAGVFRRREPAGDVVRVRVGNAPDMATWVDPATREVECLDAAQAAREDAMLGLRLTAGIGDELAERARVTEVLESLAREGLVERIGGRWRTTQRGWLLGNEVYARVWNADPAGRA